MILNDFILLRQTREERTSKTYDGKLFNRILVDFVPIIGGEKQQPIVFPQTTELSALRSAQKRFPNQLLAVQPYREFLECHQKPKFSPHSLKPSGQRPGS